MVNDGYADLDYREWVVRVEITSAGEAFSAHADLFCEGQHKCRMALSSSRVDETAARLALCAKARDFIDDWISRTHTGDTRFLEL